MSFLLNLVPCCGVAPGRYVPANAPTDEETTSLVQAPDGDKSSYRSRKVGGRSTVTPLQWRPSLCTISEDDVAKEDVTRCVGGKLVKTVGSKPKFGASQCKIDLRLQDTSASIPSVPSAAFLF